MKKILPLLTAVFIFAGCEKENYNSEPPLLKDITIRSLTTGESEVHVGEKFVLTAEQKKKGKLLNATKYTWSCDNEAISHKYNTSVIYDQESQNPTDTLIATNAGSYIINFTAKYNASGDTQDWSSKYGSSFSEPFPDNNGKATYTTGGILYYTIQAQKRITVLE